MKTKLILIATALLGLLCALFLSACFQTRPKIKEINPAFSKYISGYTAGMVSRKSVIRIELTQGLNEVATQTVAPPPAISEVRLSNPAPLNEKNVEASSLASALPDSSLLKNAFHFEPAIKGRAVWISDRVIEFIPAEPLATNQFYHVSFNLDKVTNVEEGLETFDFQLSTYPQNLFVNLDGLRSYDDYNIEWQKLTGKITTSDYEDTTAIRKVLAITRNGKALPFKFDYSYRNNEFFFYVDSIKRSDVGDKILVSWTGEPVKAISSGTQEVLVPGLGDFKITNAKVIDGDDQFVELTFSDPLEHTQNLKGIITIEGANNISYAINGNLMKIFLEQRIEGDKLISVSTGVKNFKGYKMNEAYSANLLFEEPHPNVRIRGNGTILPNSQGLIFPFEAIALKSVDVRVIKILSNNVHQFLQTNNLDGEDGLKRVGKIVAEKKIALDYNKKINLKQWNKHVIDLGKLITPEQGAIYRVSIRFRKSDAICDCTETSGDSESENDDDEETGYRTNSRSANEKEDLEWHERDWGRYGFSGYESWEYYYNDEYSPCSEYYYHGRARSRNILASNLGLIYKLDDNKTSHAFVSDMLTAKPLAGVTIEYYDYIKQVIASGVTNENGMLDLQLNRKPFLMLAKFGEQRGYLKLLDGYANSLSKFDVEGEVVQKGVKGLIYGERGVWRPGDSLYLVFMVEDKEKRLPPNHPVKFELLGPDGQVVYHVTKTKNVNGIYDFRTATSPDAPTGNYRAVARVGNRVFSHIVKIETVKPNRLKIYLDVDKTKNDSVATLSAKWLHGATAKNLRALVNVSVNQTRTTFAHYRSYVFDSPIRSYYSESETVLDGFLDEKGKTELKTSLHVGRTAPGMLRATYVTKVFEEGGDFSIDRHSVLYSPFNTYVGLQSPVAGNFDNTLETGTAYNFNVLTVNADGKTVNADRLQVKIYKIQWRWWYEKDNEDLAQYVSRAGTFVLKDTLIKTKDGKGSFKFRIQYPEYGRYLITVTDLNGGHQTGQTVTIDWPYWRRGNRTGNENATMLNFACDKKKYVCGEKVKLSFPSPSDGMALVSVETGLRVVQKFWIPTKKGETVYEFPATKEMTPNAYVHVTLIQPHHNTKNDLPIRMYGVVPISVDEPLSHLTPEIKMPEILKPESVTSIKVKEKNGRKMSYTLAMVDDGLLDLTRFKTPQPWSTFYAREALGVKTWDMYDAVIGAYAGKLDKLLSLGGDGDANAAKGAKANRFKPMVKFLGPFTLEAGQEKTHQVEIPNYIGSVRVMVVARYEGAYGNAEKTVAVRKPLMILATLPRVLGPGEEVYLPVNVFAMENHVKDVKVEVEASDLLSLTSKEAQTVHFDNTGDEVINFKMTVANRIGIAKVKVIATSGNERTVQEIELDVRTPNPKVTDGKDVALEPGQEWKTDISFIGLSGTNRATLEFSRIPSISLERRLAYLIQYPHGCIEQTTSSVFPQLYVINLMHLKENEKRKIANNVTAGLKRLQLFQTANGGFAYWPGENVDSEWGSNYAGHFMIEAEKLGYSLPSGMKNRWIKYQQQQARAWNANSGIYSHPHGNETNEIIQAYRLFVLALSNYAEIAAMNRLREEKNLSTTAKWRLAAAYQIAGQTEVATKLIENLSVTVTPYKELSYSYGSDLRDKAMILETLSFMRERTRAWPLAQELAKTFGSENWMSTQETAYGLLALCEFSGVKENDLEIKVSYRLDYGDVNNLNSKKSLVQVKFNDKEITQKTSVTVKNTGKSTLFVKAITEGIPLIGNTTASAKDLSLTVIYKDMKGKVIQPDKLIQGTEFLAEVTVYNPGTKGHLKEMALNQIFPSGWEIHNTRMDETIGSNAARYQDIRDDRVYSYYDLLSQQQKTIIIHLNATYLGKFYLPTVYTEAMYDNTINARVPGRWVEVVKDEGIVATK